MENMPQISEDFVIEDGILVEYLGHEANIVIPNGVTAIGEAFLGNQDIVSVIVPEGVKSIGECAFLQCTSLENVQFPKSLRYIGNLAFGSTKLRHLVLPEGLEEIGMSAFGGCGCLEGVQMPESLSCVGEGAFKGCRNLKEIDLSNVKKIGGEAFEHTGLTYVNLASLEQIGVRAFADTKVAVFDGMEHLPEMYGDGNAFQDSLYWSEYGRGESENTFWIVDGVLLSGQGCSGEVKIPKTVQRIAPCAFYNNSKITSVLISDSVVSIGRNAFHGCTKLKTLRMEDSVTELGEYAFWGCSRLAEIRLSNQLKEIPEECFGRCEKLKRITLPENLAVVDYSRLPYCAQKQITIPPESKVLDIYKVLEGDVFYVTDLKQVSNSSVLKKVARTNEMKELALDAKELTLKVGEKYPLRFNSGAKATWKSSKRSVATVGKTGNIYAKNPGTTVITATIYGEKYSCKVKVVAE